MSAKMPKTSIKEKLKSFKAFLKSDDAKNLSKAVQGINKVSNTAKDTLEKSADQKGR